MKKEKILKTAVIPGLIAVAAILLSTVVHVGADVLLACGGVLMLIAIGAVEYRLNWKELIGR